MPRIDAHTRMWYSGGIYCSLLFVRVVSVVGLVFLVPHCSVNWIHVTILFLVLPLMRFICIFIADLCLLVTMVSECKISDEYDIFLNYRIY